MPPLAVLLESGSQWRDLISVGMPEKGKVQPYEEGEEDAKDGVVPG